MNNYCNMVIVNNFFRKTKFKSRHSIEHKKIFIIYISTHWMHFIS